MAPQGVDDDLSTGADGEVLGNGAGYRLKVMGCAVEGTTGLKNLPTRLSIAGRTGCARPGRFAPHRTARIAMTEHRPDLGPFSPLLGYRVVEWGPKRRRPEAEITPGSLDRSGTGRGGGPATFISSSGGHPRQR